MTVFETTGRAVLRTPLLRAREAALAHDPQPALGDPRITRALAIGCPDLLDTLRRSTTRDRDRQRARASLARYLVRMSTRPTPYGAFAAASVVEWGEDTSVALDDAGTIRTRPDMGWLLGLVHDVENDPDGRHRVTLEKRLGTRPALRLIE